MSFWENDKSFSLDCLPLKSEQEFKKGLWLVLTGINEIPPHVALISEGEYYSVSTSKVDCGTPFDRFLKVVSRKNIQCLFIGVVEKNKESSNVIARNEAISINLLLSIYKNLEPLGHNINTCLSPIKEFFAKYYSSEFESSNYVFELLALAEKKNIIGDCFSLHVELAGTNSLTLPKYTMVQIKNRISALSQNHKSYLVNHT